MKLGESISKEIFQKIKYDILNLTIKGGDFLTLADFSEKYGVSKTPIRDALNELEKEGFLKALPRKGYLVIPVTQNDVREFFQIRVILERAAAAIAIKCAEQHELKEIMRLARQFPMDGHPTDFAEFNRLNIEFHMSIIRAAHNTVMADISAGVMENLFRIMLADSKHLDLSLERGEHIAIAQALLDKDSDKAEKMIVRHITELQKRAHVLQVDIV